MFWIIAVLKTMLDSTDLERVHELRSIAIPEPWREAWIFLDHIPCENVSALSVCLGFAPELTFPSH